MSEHASGGPRANEESWAQVAEFVTYLAGNPVWLHWTRVARATLDALARDGLHQAFRAGTSMHHIMFSTLDHHGLEGEPFVAVEIEMDGSQVRIGYTTQIMYFSPPDEERRVPPEQAPAVIKQFLAKLWAETKPHLPLPGGLRGG